MRQFVAVTKALACEQRLRVLMALRERELSEGVISEMLGLTPSTKDGVRLDAYIPLWEYTCDCIYESGPNVPVPV